MKRRILLMGVLGIVLAGAAIIWSCTRENSPVPDNGTNVITGSQLKFGQLMSITPNPLQIVAGQHLDAGDVSFDFDGEVLQVTYTTKNGWLMDQIHFWIGTSANGYPQVTKGKNAGSPIPGQFPYKFENLGGITTYSFNVTLSDGFTCDQVLWVVAHCAVKLPYGDGTFLTQTGWTPDVPLPGDNWAMESQIKVTCDVPPIIPGSECTKWDYQTAFGGTSVGLTTGCVHGGAWWYYYQNDGQPQTIYAGQSIEIGTVTFSNGTLTIELTDGWELQPVNEPVKIQAYEDIPDCRPATGLFTTYKGTDLTIDNLPDASFFVIHLDVQKCTLWQ
jgi:hypothetical protein